MSLSSRLLKKASKWIDENSNPNQQNGQQGYYNHPPPPPHSPYQQYVGTQYAPPPPPAATFSPPPSSTLSAPLSSYAGQSPASSPSPSATALYRPPPLPPRQPSSPSPSPSNALVGAVAAPSTGSHSPYDPAEDYMAFNRRQAGQGMEERLAALALEPSSKTEGGTQLQFYNPSAQQLQQTHPSQNPYLRQPYSPPARALTPQHTITPPIPQQQTITPSVSTGSQQQKPEPLRQKSAKREPPKIRKILSLDGGGVRGLSIITILRYIMKNLNRQRGYSLDPWEEFDMMWVSWSIHLPSQNYRGTLKTSAKTSTGGYPEV